jgi:hypothetical protein
MLRLAMCCDEDEIAAHVRFISLSQGLDRMVFGGGAPRRAGVVDQMSTSPMRVAFPRPAGEFPLPCAVRRDPACVDARACSSAVASSRSAALRESA